MGARIEVTAREVTARREPVRGLARPHGSQVLAVVGWLFLAAAGLWGLYERFTMGHRLAGYTSYVPWGLWVVVYIYLAGLAAGTYLVGTSGVLLGIKPLERLAPLALWASFVSLSSAIAIIGLDLGHLERFWEVYTRPNFGSSVMAWVIWMYTAFLVVLAVMLRLAARPEGSRPALLRWLTGAGAVLAIAFNGGGGALFGVLGARPLWNSGAYPLLFIVTALTSGAALLALIASLRRDTEAARLLGGATLVLLVLDALIEFAEVSIALWAAVPSHIEGYRLYLFGPHWWLFWLVHVGLGVVVPVAVLAWGRRSVTGVGIAGFLVVVTLIAVRWNIVIPGLSVPEFRGLLSAYTDPRLTNGYVPTPMEWRVVAAVLAAGLALFYLGHRYLPAVQSEGK